MGKECLGNRKGRICRFKGSQKYHVQADTIRETQRGRENVDVHAGKDVPGTGVAK